MKRLVFLLAAMICTCGVVAAFPKNDSRVRKGVLPNGLTYYICNNDYPQGYADFYLVVKAGIVDQRDENSGVAHFLEHVCFNGTEHFPGNSMAEWLRGKGVAEGENFNAATSGESTVYVVGNVPVQKQSVVDSCILILRDLAHYVEISEESVEREKAVILEEFRYRDNAEVRVSDASRRYIYGDTKYGRYVGVGKEESVRKMTAGDVREFYDEMYRPDRQAVIIVGSVNVNDVEKSLKEAFADVPAVSSPIPERNPSVAYDEGPVAGLIYDSDLAMSGLRVMWRYRTCTYDGDKMSDYREDMMKFMVGKLIDGRLAKQNSSGAMSVEITMGHSLYSTDLSAMELAVSAVPGRELSVFRTAMEEVEKVRRHGFTEQEVERLCEELRLAYSEYTTPFYSAPNAQIVSDLYENFLYGTPYMDPKTRYNTVVQMLKSIDAEGLGRFARNLFTDVMPVIVCSMPSREGTGISETDFIGVLDEIKGMEFEAAGNDSAVQTLPDLSGLEGARTEYRQKYSDGTVVWYLDNGMKVVFSPASKDSDVIGVDLFWKGGLSMVPTDELAVFEDNILGMYFKNSGVAGLSQTALNRFLSGKSLAVSPYIYPYTHGVTGQASVREAESLFRLIYLYAASPRFDEREFEDILTTLKDVMPTLMKQPSHEIETLSSPVSYGGNPRHLVLDGKLLAKARLEHLKKNYNRMFANAAGSTAVIIGDFKPKQLQKLIEKYLGSIPTMGIASDIVYDNAARLVTGKVSREFTMSSESSTAEVTLLYHAPMEFSPANHVAVQAVQYILSVRVNDLLREKEGAAYSPQVYADLTPVPDGLASLQLIFRCDPAEAGRLRALAAREVDRLAVDGPAQTEVEQAVRYICNGMDEMVSSMSYRFRMMKELELFGTTSAFAYRSAMALTPEKVRDALGLLLGAGNCIEYVARPSVAESE